MRLGPTELMIVLAIVLILFGPSQLPKLTKMFRKTRQNFEKGMEEGHKAEDDEDEEL